MLLLDANRLVKMNIQNFDHIKQITSAIRKMYDVPDLYNYVPDMYHGIHLWQTHYKLYRVKSGLKYQRTRRTDLWRRLRLLRKKREYLIHWQILERWLRHKQPDEWERVGLIHRYNLYHTKQYPPPPVLPWYLKTIKVDLTTCNCMTPCTCDWELKREEYRVRLGVLGGKTHKTRKEMGDDIVIEDRCRFKTVLQVLSYHLPNKYKQTVDEFNLKMPRKSVSAKRIPSFQWNQRDGDISSLCYTNTLRMIDDDTQFSAELAAAGMKLVVVDFTASWCPPCQRMAPLFKQMPGKYPEAVFIKIDVDECEDIALAQGIWGVPTFIFYRYRAQIGRVIGDDIEGLHSKIRQHIVAGGGGGEELLWRHQRK